MFSSFISHNFKDDSLNFKISLKSFSNRDDATVLNVMFWLFIIVYFNKIPVRAQSYGHLINKGVIYKIHRLTFSTDLYVNFTLIVFFLIPFRLFETLQSLFWSIFGLLNLYVTNVKARHEFTEFVGATMFGTYNVISLVVLLNMLIAMMNNSYQLIAVSYNLEPLQLLCNGWIEVTACTNEQVLIIISKWLYLFIFFSCKNTKSLE